MQKKVLYITANPKAMRDSVSLTVGEAFIDMYVDKNKDDGIKRLDLYNMDIPLIDYDTYSYFENPEKLDTVKLDEISNKTSEKIKSILNNLKDFMEADRYVFVTSLWNLGIPPMLKAYIDNIAIEGKTFKYDGNTSKGLLKGKKAIIIQSSGQTYFRSDRNHLEHGVTYLKTILNFMGIEGVKELSIEGLDLEVTDREKIKEIAIVRAKEVAEDW